MCIGIWVFIWILKKQMTVRLRFTDCWMCFFGTANPKRVLSVPFFLAINKSELSLERNLEEKTFLNSSGRLSLLLD